MGKAVKKIVKSATRVALAVGTGGMSEMQRAQKKQQEKARKAAEKAQAQASADAKEADAQARRSQVFSETEGKGTGQFGQVQLGVDENIDEEEELNVRSGRSGSLSI